MSIRLTEHFMLDEFCRSQIAARRGLEIVVEPGGEVFENLARLCRLVLEPLRAALGPVYVTSGYRPPEVNSLVGGSPTSGHLLGLAADVVVEGRTSLAVSHWLASAGRDGGLPFDQVIHEFDRWTHVSVAPAGKTPRGEAMTAFWDRTTGHPAYLMSILERRKVA